MVAKDKFHDAVKTGLQKEDWMITDEHLKIPVERLTNMYIDIAAEKIVLAERANIKIAVEVKSFLGPSTLTEFHMAMGQYMNYRYALMDIQPERTLYLAVPNKIYKDFFSTPFIQSVVQRSQTHLLIYNPTNEEILQWIS